MNSKSLNVIFDMDGVIFDTERMYLECCIPAAAKLGFDDAQEVERVANSCIGLTEPETNRTLLEYFGDEEILEAFNQEMYRIFKSRYDEDGLPLKEGVHELLGFLKECGAATAIGSSTRTDLIKTELCDAGLIDYFDVIVGGDMAAKSKPEPDVFLLAAEKLGKPASDCIIIEDSFNGIRAARRAGGTVFMVPDLLQPTDEILALTDKVFGSLTEVLEYFRAGQ